MRENAAFLRQEIEGRQEAGNDEHLAELRGHLDLTLAMIRAAQARAEMLSAPDGSPERAAAERTLEAATRAAATRVGQLEAVIPGKRQWYMRMYAQRPGESAHDTNAELLSDQPSAEANPFTAVVLRGQLALPVSVTFAKDAHQTPESAKHPVRHLAKVVARAGLWNAANGLPLPDVTISGTRGGRLFGRDLTRTRAEAVAASFRQELADALAAHQEGALQPHLTADDFTVEPVAVRGRSALNRRRGHHHRRHHGRRPPRRAQGGRHPRSPDAPAGRLARRRRRPGGGAVAHRPHGHHRASPLRGRPALHRVRRRRARRALQPAYPRTPGRARGLPPRTRTTRRPRRAPGRTGGSRTRVTPSPASSPSATRSPTPATSGSPEAKRYRRPDGSGSVTTSSTRRA